MSTLHIQAAIDITKLQLLKLNVLAEIHAKESLVGIEVDDLIKVIRKHAPLLQINLTEETLNDAVLMVRMEIDVIGGKSAVSIDGESVQKNWYSKDLLKKAVFGKGFTNISTLQKNVCRPQLSNNLMKILMKLSVG